MKRLIGYTFAICLLAMMVGCGGVTSTGTLAYVSNSAGTGFTVFTVNSDGTLTKSSISPQNTPASPKVLQFSPNGKWAYFLDVGGANIYAYTRAGNGTLATLIGAFRTGPLASSLVVSSNSTFLYVALPNAATPSQGKLAVYSIDAATGIPTQVGSNIQAGYSISQLVIAPAGSILFGLTPSQQQVVSWSLNASSGVPTVVGTFPVGTQPSYMILSANGSFMYVLDHLDVGTNNNNVQSPSIYAFNVSAGNLTTMPGQPFHENADVTIVTPTNPNGTAPTNPVAGATSNDTRYLFIANQGSHNISSFKINPTTGEPTEVLVSTTIVNGISVSTGSPFDCGTGCTTPSFLSVSTANNALYLLDTPTGKLFQFAIDQNTGRLRALNPASVTAESASSDPTWITIR